MTESNEWPDDDILTSDPKPEPEKFDPNDYLREAARYLKRFSDQAEADANRINEIESDRKSIGPLPNFILAPACESVRQIKTFENTTLQGLEREINEWLITGKIGSFGMDGMIQINYINQEIGFIAYTHFTKEIAAPEQTAAAKSENEIS